jgi:hypothetical protein
MSEPTLDPVVNEYLDQLQERFQRFNDVRRRTLQREGQGGVGRLFTEYFGFGNKQNLELILRGMLTTEEVDRLRTDPKFTEAWQIFVDFRWLRRLLLRLLVLAVGTVAALAFVGWAGWSLLQFVIFVLSPRK